MVSFVHFYGDFIKVFYAQVHARLGLLIRWIMIQVLITEISNP